MKFINFSVAEIYAADYEEIHPLTVGPVPPVDPVIPGLPGRTGQAGSTGKTEWTGLTVRNW